MHTDEAKDWYGMNVVKYEIVKCLKHRELAFMDLEHKTVRDMNGWNVRYLDMCMDAYGFFRKDYRMYMSVAQLMETPIASFDPNKRKDDKETVKEAWKYYDDYDFAVDLDAPDLDKAKEEAIKLTKIFDRDGVPYSVTFSGARGFHVRVSGRDIPPCEDKIKLCQAWALSLCDVDGVNYIDASIYDHRRILKVPYSIDHKTGEYLVVLPLTKEQLYDFNVEHVKLNYVLKNVKLFNRGLLTREGDVDDTVHHLKRRSLI
jgi:hypothetical protein